jgi:hypothetical protein
MSARALVSGRLWCNPERRVSNSGKPFGAATVRVGSGGSAVWWKVLTFGETATEELLSLRDGDALSASGEFIGENCNGRDGPKVGFTLFADRVLSAKHKRREAAPAIIREKAARPFNDRLDDLDGWAA